MRTTTQPRLAAAAIAAVLIGGVATPATAQPTAGTGEEGKLMLVLDASGSMAESLGSGGTKISAARSALHEVTKGLPAGQPVGLRVFGATQPKSSGTACTDSQRVVDLATGDRDALDSAIDRVKPYGETPIGYALQQAAKDLGTEGQRSIVLVSDGEPTCAPDPCVVAGQLAAMGVSTRVDVVGLAVSGAARAKLKCIADRGEGRYFDADSAEDLANALDSVAVRSAVPFRTAGTPVTGTNTRVGAPLVAPGDYLTTLGGVGTDRQTQYFVVRRMQADSTLHVSIDTPKTGETDQVQLALLDAEGNTCGSDSGWGSGGADTTAIIAASVSIPRSRDASDLDCAAAGDFVVKVDHGNGYSASYGRRSDIPVELRIREEAPVADVDSLPQTAETPVWQDPSFTATGATAGGDSLNTPTLLTPGAYRGTIATGDTQVFAVDLDYGQSLAAAARASISPLLGDRLRNGGWPTLSVQLLSPSRIDAAGGNAFRSDADDHARGSSSIYQGSDGRVVYEYTNTVAYRNRFGSGDAMQGASEAGRYLVVVSLLDSDADSRRNVVPFTLGVAVRGDVSGVPTTIGGSATEVPATDAPSATAAPSTAATSTTERSSKPSEEQALGPIDLVSRSIGFGAIGLGVIVVLAGAGIGAVVLIRRASRG